MPSNSTVLTDRFVPQNVARPQQVLPTPTTNDTSAGATASSVATQNFLYARQYVNPMFDAGTLGDTRYLGDEIDQVITRGYIRRAAPTTGDVMSQAQLNFMYNPEAVVRDYVSYLDQEALDPFNTVYGSGNLIAPPSFINFSFNLFFDRQVQTANGSTPKGVLEDYDFFDIVVRNVAPGGGTTAVPDNGIMMINPKDIMVVFSEHLTVQGRPTNARVAFERFNSKMTPVRMTVSLTMIVTYFGPLRDAFTLDTTQQIEQWKAMVPYSDIYKEEFTQQEADVANTAYKKTSGDIANFVNALPRNQSWANAATTGVAVSGVGTVASGNLARDTLDLATKKILPSTVYTQGAGRTSLPASGDCSGALWHCYNAFGASKVLHGSDGPANTASIANWGRKNNWQTMQIVCIPGSTSEAQMRQIVMPGDVVLRSPNSGHCGFFNSWTASGWKITHQTSGGRNGTKDQSINYLKSFNWVLRPNPSGSTTTTGTWIPIGGSDVDAA